MPIEDGAKYLIESFKSLGIWVWLILFGGFVVVFAVINRPEYVPLGLYIFIDGAIGYFIGMLVDRLSTWRWGEKENGKLKKNEKGQNIVEPPWWYSVILVIYRLGVLCLLIYFIIKRYPDFLKPLPKL
jgi:hypothetical protein